MDINFQSRNLEKKILTIKDYIYTLVAPLDNIRFKTGELNGAEHPDFDDSSWKHFSLEQPWGGKDTITWFRIPFKVPDNMKYSKYVIILQPGKRFYFKGSEGGDLREYELMIYLDGEPLQSVGVRRNEIHLWDLISAGENHLLAVEAFSGLEEHQHTFEQADLMVINKEVEEYYYNVKNAFDAYLAGGDSHEESPRIFRALQESLLMVDFLRIGETGFFESISCANEFIRKELYSDTSFKSYPKAISVGHAHLDIAWKWQTKHSKRKAARTFANAIRLMDLYPDYHFIQSQPQLYKYVKENYPALYEKVKEKIKNGQWEATGGMWVESDCNLPSGESFVRQFLYGKKFFKNEFGIEDQLLWLPDCFGFCYSLPQILKKSGVNFFMTTKLSWAQFVKVPYDSFYWEGLDGTKILSHIITTPDPRGWHDYSIDLNPVVLKSCWDNYRQQQDNPEVLLSFGWGDGGGGPTREMQENALRFNHLKTLPHHEQGRAETFFKNLEKNCKRLPVWNDELYLQLHRGCYTSQAGIKKNNRFSEILYQNVELFASLSFLQSGHYPQKEIEQGWELILLNQFHDILPGSSIPEVYEDSEKEFEQVRAIGHKHLKASFDQLCSQLSSSPEGKNLVLFNPLSWQRSDVLCLDLEQNMDNMEIIDNTGQKLPWQKTSNKKQVLIHSTNTPSMGYQTLEIRESTSSETYPSSLRITKTRLENRFYDIQLNKNGLFTSVFDKTANREVIEEGKLANVFQFFEDRPLKNNAWDIDSFYQDKCLELIEVEDIKIVETGPIRAGLFIKRKFLDSTICQTIYIYDHIPRIDFKTKVDWNQHQTLLKVAFPVNVHANKASYEIPFGNIERPTHWNTAWDYGRFEVPAQKWADLSEGDYGVSLLNDCKYGYDIKDNIIRLTLIKSGIDPDPNADIGTHSFCYSLYPHQGTWREGNTTRMAYELNYPLLSRVIDNGELRHSAATDFSFAQVNRENVIIETVKKAEDSNKLVLRVYETCNQRGDVEIQFGYPVREIRESNLIEEILEPVDVKEDILKFYIKPYEIKTFLIDFGVI